MQTFLAFAIAILVFGVLIWALIKATNKSAVVISFSVYGLLFGLAVLSWGRFPWERISQINISRDGGFAVMIQQGKTDIQNTAAEEQRKLKATVDELTKSVTQLKGELQQQTALASRTLTDLRVVQAEVAPFCLSREKSAALIASLRSFGPGEVAWIRHSRQTESRGVAECLQVALEEAKWPVGKLSQTELPDAPLQNIAYLTGVFLYVKDPKNPTPKEAALKKALDAAMPRVMYRAGAEVQGLRPSLPLPGIFVGEEPTVP